MPFSKPVQKAGAIRADGGKLSSRRSAAACVCAVGWTGSPNLGPDLARHAARAGKWQQSVASHRQQLALISGELIFGHNEGRVSNLMDLKAVLVIALIFIPLERLLPLHAEHSSARGHWPNDVVYLLFNGIIIKIALIIVIGTAMLLLHQLVPAGLTQAVRLQPVWLQAMEVLVLADTGFYLSHRAFHAVPFLRRFHSIHHSVEEMDWLAAHRVHPVDQILTKSASFLPVFALDFRPPPY